MAFRPPYHGIWPAMATPMDADGNVVPGQVAPLVEKLLAEGAGGFYLCGSTGQGPLLTVAERTQVAEAAISAVAGRVPVVVHVGSVRIEESLTLACHAAEAGADGVSSVPPFYYQVGLDMALEHYRRIASVTDLPFYAYNFTIPGGNVAEYVPELLRVPNLAGLKFTNRDPYEMALLKVLSGGKLNVMSGADECFLACRVHGADGAIGTTYNTFLPLFRRIESASDAGDNKQSSRLMLTAVDLVHRLVIPFGMAGIHAILGWQGVEAGVPRHPHKPLDPSSREELRRCYAEFEAENLA